MRRVQDVLVGEKWVLGCVCGRGFDLCVFVKFF